uniref:helix-turn-helix domain-containing protein n=1 Tax=uncultured Acinetobacter sp. TaxID=165433 RepID=UPI0026329AA0|nr:XRE family transcriptional regulator [uncultured Acinetobacter sp.]
MFNGNRLLLALESQGFTNVAFANLMDVNRSTVTRWINDPNFTPRPDVLLKMSEILKVNIEWFQSKPKAILQTVEFYRSNASTTKLARNIAKSKLVFSAEIYQILSEWVGFPETKLPKSLTLSEWHALDNNKIDELAKECRRLWGLGNEPIDNLIGVAESNGIVVVKDELGTDASEQMDGVSAWYNDVPFVFIIKDTPAVRSRFDLAHEIGHLIMHKAIPIEDYNKKEIYKKIENQAHRFANELLYPSDIAIDELYYPTLEKFIQLKMKWLISIQAILRKALDLELITEDEYIKFYKTISYRKWRKHEPLDDELIGEQPTLFAKVFEMLLEDGGFSRKSIIDKVFLPPKRIEALLSLPSGFLSENSAPKIKLKIL